MKKHEVRVVCGDNAYGYLSKKAKGVDKISSLRLMYSKNRVSNIKTISYNLKHLKREGRHSIKIVKKVALYFALFLILDEMSKNDYSHNGYIIHACIAL